MGFISLAFLIFLAVALLVYWSLKTDRWRHSWLLFANFVFYGWWDWRFTGLLAAVILVSYFSALMLSSTGGDCRLRKLILLAGCILLVGVLGYFKYSDFFIESLRTAARQAGFELGWSTLNIVLPVGVSFYIFQGLGYIATVYQKRISAERNLIKVAVYLSFFPHLVAGPIIHASYFLPQLASVRKYDSRQALEGCRLFLWGLIYKAVFADNIGSFVDKVFAPPLKSSSLEMFAGCLGFYSQIYFDFAGYSLMAIGIAKLFGYELPENFRFPYRAASISDFWRRWHISLSTWLRDYIYIPLGGNRGSNGFQCRNTMYTMLIGGLWHGASWNFVIWGALHGAALCVNHLWKRSRISKLHPISAGTGFFLTQVTVFLLWIPFRSESGLDTLVILDSFLTWSGQPTLYIPWLLITAPLLVDTWLVGGSLCKRADCAGTPLLLYAALALTAIVSLLFMHKGNLNFIYFQF